MGLLLVHMYIYTYSNGTINGVGKEIYMKHFTPIQDHWMSFCLFFYLKKKMPKKQTSLLKVEIILQGPLVASTYIVHI